MMKKTILLLVFALGLTVVSCSKNDDDVQNSGTGVLKITGKVMSPNDAFPIATAKVKVYKGESLLAEQVTDALGDFVVDKMPNGNLRVVMSKGKFSRTLHIDLQSDYELLPSERSFDTFPHIGVVTGNWDAIENILFNVGIVDGNGDPAFDILDGATGRASGNIGEKGHDHQQIAARTAELEPNVSYGLSELLHDTGLLATYDIIFMNCGSNTVAKNDAVAMTNLKNFIENGGIVYATDFSYEYLKAMFPTGYLSFATPEKSGSSVTATVTISDPDLSAWLEGQGITVTPNVEINGFLGGWQMVGDFDPAVVDDWVVADAVTYGGLPVANKALAFTYGYGCGGVFYSSFHTHGNNTSEATIAQMMNYFVFELSDLGSGCGNN